MARVSRLWIYPIKGLDGVEVDTVEVLASGALALDRRWALTDARGRFVNGKNRLEVHTIRAVYDVARREVAIDGRALSLDREGAAIAAWFSERLGEPVVWSENAAAGFPDDTVSPGPTFVGEVSLDAVAHWFGLDGVQTRGRFRTNIEIGGIEAFAEDGWYGGPVRIGEVTVDVVNPCQRCVVPSRDAWTGAQDAGFQKRFADLRRQHLPPWAKAEMFSHYYRMAVNTRIAASEAGKTIRVGDRVAAPAQK